MKRSARLALVAAAPLLAAAIWMDHQPSLGPYEAPVLSPPAAAVPVKGREVVSPESIPKNPVAAGRESLARGAKLFDINCAMCHGRTSAERGPVGRKLNPPPPGLEPGMVQGLSDSDIFKAVTFGFGRMPPFREKIAPGERWDLVNFLRSRR